MRARQVFLESLLAHDVNYIFGNPGSTENAVVDGMFEYPELSYILALHEGVAVGAATFYAQASGRTPLVNLHAGPGLGNAIGMIYGGLRANVPMIVSAGQQDTRMRLLEPILGHDLAAMAAPVVKWSMQIEHADEVSLAVRRAHKIANEAPKGPVFLSMPLNVMEDETEAGPEGPGVIHRAPAAHAAGIEQAAAFLSKAAHPVIVAGDGVAQDGADGAVGRLAEITGAEIWFEPSRARYPVAADHLAVRGSLPFDSVGMRAIFDEADAILLVGGRFFEELWYNADTSPLSGIKADVVQIDDAEARLARFHPIDLGLIGDIEATVTALCDSLADGLDGKYRAAAEQRLARIAPHREQRAERQRARAGEPGETGKVSVPHAMAAMRDELPADTAFVAEVITTRPDFDGTFDYLGINDYFGGRGGGIGQGIAGAIGVKLAYPERPVVAVCGDGSAMYSIQALWTAAHHDLAIVFIIFSNREYRILKRNLDEWRRRFSINSNAPNPLLDIAEPPLDFVALAKGMGVDGAYVNEDHGVAPAVRQALDAGRPFLIEMEV
ncbi:MAG: thiamine pyrophosphate-binding protein [Rhodospirillales bacterium]|jgi:benzoylformate decarboxylase|nr:thiamine pyrophosphate-binding protein [Rhodospirillales bacterium]MDP6645046.1 thiamine pyrophosphate-binding protein [Rhodospirillales bacterium]MDP6842258.1 thiamine pyrophosphate-binding protein [Rhodospirillales bacterium]